MNSSIVKKLSFALLGASLASISFAHTANIDALPYPLSYLETQFHNWLLINQGKEGLIKGGYQSYTSEGLGFQVLIASGILKLEPNNQDAKNSITSVYQFIYGNNELANGLLPWAFDKNLKVTSQYSATDADIYLAEGFYQAGKLLNNSKYTQAATNMMQAIYQYDTTKLNGSVFLNQGGANAGSNRNKPVNGVAGIAYSKTALSFLADFSQVDPNKNDHWNTVIQDTLQAMSSIQNTVQQGDGVPASNWGGVLGFVGQGVPGAAYITYNNGFKLNTSGNLNTLNKWTFNYDAGRVPLMLGSYVASQCQQSSNQSSNNCQLAKAVLSKEMGGENTYGINGVFFDYAAPNNGYKVYLPDAGSSGGTYASIYKNGQSVEPPSQSNPNAYSDDFLNASFLLGDLSNNGWGNGETNPATESAMTLMSSSSGAYYGGAYKLLVGLIIDGAYGSKPFSSNQYVINHVTPPTKFTQNTRVVLQPDQVKAYYEDYLLQPAVMQPDITYKIKVVAQFQNGEKQAVNWQQAKSWSGTVSKVSSQGNCAIFKVSASRPDYQSFGLIGVGGNWSDSEDAPTLKYIVTNSDDSVTCNA